MSFYDAIRVGASGAADFEVKRSLRFNSGDSTHLTRTPSSATNRQTFTFSFWVKLVTIGTVTYLFECGDSDNNGERLYIRLDTDSSFSVGEKSIYRLITTQKLRDPSAWYHIVFAVDTTNSTPDNRNRLYINGEEVTSFGTRNSFSQNYNTGVNNNSLHNWGRSNIDSNYPNAYLAEINFIDGQQLTPSSFAETNSETGQWVPIDTSGLTFGTNGYRLKFADNSGTTATTLGKDSSGNGNNFTPNNFSVAAGAGNDSLEDTPTNNFCTLNSIALGQGNEQRATLSNGNLDFTESSSNNRTAVSTFGLKTGKWYFEFLSTNTGTFSIGWHDMENNQGSFYRNNGSYSSSFGGGGTSGYASWKTNDIVGVAIDFDSGKIWYAKNNTWQSGDPATGNSPTNTFTTGLTLHTEAFTDNSSGTKSGSFNYGQRPFTYTPPAGYKSICSKNLPDPTILLPNKHFDTLLWSGNATTSDRSITGLNFQPDWAWTKTRNHAYHHALFDAIRGPANRLNLDQDYVENFTSGGSLASFDAPTSGNNNGGITWDYGTGNEWWNVSGKNYISWNWNAGDTDSATYIVKVVSDSGNKYRFNDFGTSAVTLDLAEGGTYTFDQSDSSMSSHPMQLSTTANGTHGGGSAYSTGVTYELDGSTVTASAFISGFSSASSRKLIITVAASAPNLNYYCYYHSGMGGAINTNSTLGSSNFEGNTQATVKANPTAGFSIISWNARGNSSGTYDTLGHGLGVRPNWLILKSRNNTGNWNVYNSNFSSANNKILQLSNTIAETTSSNYWGADNTTPSSTLIHLNQGNYSNSASPPKFIMYAFSEVTDYSRFGSYSGNGSTDGTFVFTGFRPAFVMIKRINATDHWNVTDNKRGNFNVIDEAIYANLDMVEDSNFYNRIDYLSNGFKYRANNSQANESGGQYVYFAFAESPFKNSRAR